MSKLIHCFGNSRNALVDTELAVNMLKVSGCRHLAVNTHNIDQVSNAGELPIGYHTATVKSVIEAFDEELLPVLNINLPTSAAEAVERTLKAVDLSGWRIIKLEVLTEDYKLVQTDEVLSATHTLLEKDPSLEIWPLIIPDAGVAKELQDIGCTMIRVMGSPIGSSAGISPEWEPEIKKILADKRKDMMLDGGVGKLEHAIHAMDLGFDQVLVNSCLFIEGIDPVTRLKEFREALNGVVWNEQK